MLFNILFIVTEKVLIFNFHLDIYIFLSVLVLWVGRWGKKMGWAYKYMQF